MIRPLRALARRLAAPTGRRVLTLAVVAGLWAWWLWGPVAPTYRWRCVDRARDQFELAPDGRTIVHTPYLEYATHVPPRRCGPVRLYDAATGRERFSLFGPEEGGQRIEGFAADGSWLIALDWQDSAWVHRVLATADGRELARFPAVRRDRDWYHWRVAPGPDARWLVLQPPEKNEVHLWDVTAGRTERVLPRTRFPIAFSADGRRIATVSPDERPGVPESDIQTAVTVWDVATGRELARQVVGDHWNLYFTFSPDGRWLAWRGRLQPVPQPRVPSAVWVWDVAAGTPPVILLKFRNEPRVCELTFSPDGRRLVLRPPGGPQFWDLTASPPARRDLAAAGLRTFEGQRLGGTDREAYFLPSDGRLLLSGDGSAAVDLRDIDDLTRRVVCRFRSAETSPEFAASPDGATLAVLTGREAPMYSEVNRLLNRYLGVPKVVPRRCLIQLSDTRTGVEQLVFSQSEYTELLGVSPDGQSLWTWTRVPNPDPKVIEGERVICGWAVPTGRPPWWLIAATAAGVLLIVADWRRTRRAAA